MLRKSCSFISPQGFKFEVLSEFSKIQMFRSDKNQNYTRKAMTELNDREVRKSSLKQKEDFFI